MIGIEVVRLGEIARIKGGKRLPKGAELMPEKTEHAYIRVTDMSENGLLTSQIMYIEQHVHDTVSRYIIGKDDVMSILALQELSAG